MSYTLTKGDREMISAAAMNLDGPAAENLANAMAARLSSLLDSGVVAVITKNNIRAAITEALARGK